MAKKKKFPPNWTDPSAYPDPEKTDGGQWAWEFIRRNPKYQKDYKILKGVKKNDSENVQTPYGYGLWVYSPHPEPGESSVQYIDRMNESAQHYKIAQLGEFLMEKWRFWGKLVDPQESDYSKVRVLYKTGVKEIGKGDEFIDSAGNRFTPEEPNDLGDYFEKRNEVMFVFDLDEPDSKLIADTTFILKENYQNRKIKKPVIGRDRSILYQTYLRLLDAKNVGAPNKEIAKLIFPNLKNVSPDFNANQRIRDNIARAEELCKFAMQFLPE